MIFKTIGYGIQQDKVPAIGQGCGMNAHLLEIAKRDFKSYINVLRAGIDYGLTYFDTAEGYFDGHSEEAIGQAIKGVPRDKVFIASKFSPEHNAYVSVLEALEGSLKRLQTDYVDLYQIHWTNPHIPLQESFRALDILMECGKVRYTGICNCSMNQLLEVGYLVHSFQAEYNLAERSIEKNILPYCQAKSIAVIAYSPLDRGLMADSDSKLVTLWDLAQKYERTMAQIILNWLVSHAPVIAIPRTGSLQHLKENATAPDFKLEQDDIECINKVFVQTPIYVLPSQIRISDDTPDAKPVYKTLQEAKENRFNHTPSPLELAEDVKENGQLKCPKVIRVGDYYSLIEGRDRYWAWVIAFGNKPIPVLEVNG